MTGAFLHSPAALAGIAGIAAAHAGAEPLAAFEAIDRYAGIVLAHRLCTINRCDAQRMRVVRLYSSHPQVYPPGGSKDKTGTAWGRHVLLEQRVFVGEGEDAIHAFFDDHAVIERLGLRSVINVPVSCGGICLGTVNFLMPRAALTAADMHMARLAGLLAMPAFLVLGGDTPAAVAAC